MRKRTTAGLVALVLAGLGGYALRRRLIARALDLPPARYSVAVERNLPVWMADGIALMADHYYPLATGSFPTILIRTPYGRGYEAIPAGLTSVFLAQRFAERGYHVVVQGVRGRFDSGGEFDPLAHEAADGRATLDWIAHQPWFNDALGLWGPSYLGYVQWAVAADAPRYLKAMVPVITASQFGTLIHREGAFSLDGQLRWALIVDTMERKGVGVIWEMLSQNVTGGQEAALGAAFQHLPLMEADVMAVGKPVPFYRNWLAHQQLDDPYWQALDHSAGVPQTTVPAHLVAGWYDIFLREQLADFAALQAAGRAPYLTVGPWYHVQPAGMMEGLREGIVWFDAHLKGDRSCLRQRPVRLYVMGAEEWRTYDSWPPSAEEVPYFLHGAGRLAPAAPEAESPPDRYRYDPADPTPSVGGALLSPQAGPRDNRALEARPDVLTYTTPPLAADLEVIGPVRLELYVRSSLAHTDFFGRVCDVHPDGRSINICDGLFRVEPGKGEAQPDGSLHLTIELSPTAHRFRTGHRLRLQVSSGAHPRFSRNLGTGEPVGTGTQMIAADQAVYHDSAHPAALILPVTSPA